MDFEIFPKAHVLMLANTANVDDDIYRTGVWAERPEYSGYALGVGLETILGPVEALYAISPETDLAQFYVSLGFSF